MHRFQLTPYRHTEIFVNILFILMIPAFLVISNVLMERQVRASNNSSILDQAPRIPKEQGQNVDNSQPYHIFLPLIAGNITNRANTNGEHPPVQIIASQQYVNHIGNSPEAPPAANNHTFVADTGGDLDQYLWRADVPDGRLNFTIGINAPVLNPEWVGTEGFLTPTALFALIDGGVLPRLPCRPIEL